MKKYPLTYIFIFIIFLIFIVDIIKPDRKFSELENRNLKQHVSFNIKDFISGDFSSEYEKYINDQFLARDSWIDLKSRSEYLLGKVENNGIIYGENGYLFEKYNTLDEDRLNDNIEALNQFQSKYKNKVITIMVPNSYEVYKEFLPIGAGLINQEIYIDKIYDNLRESTKLDVLSIMKENKEKYIYYKTDHHWTTEGAYLVYLKMMDSMGYTPKTLLEFGERNQVDNFYGTYYSRAKLFNAQSDVITFYEVPNISMTIESESYNSLYDYSYFNTRDKYSAFLRGNNALTVIKNKENTNGKKILVIKDSFGNSLVPFLSSSFEEVHIIDLRAFMYKISDYIEKNNFDNIAVLYNFINFSKDTNIIKLKR